VDFAASAAQEPRMALQMWVGEAKSRDFQAFPRPCPPGGQKGCFPQQPQVGESNAREMRARGGQPGIPNETVGAGCCTPVMITCETYSWRSGGHW